MKKLPLFLLSLILCANDDILSQAKKLEDEGRYKEAMLLYKQVALKEQSSSAKRYQTREEFYDTSIKKPDDNQTSSSLRQLIAKDFGIYPYKKNYLLPATHTFNKIDGRDHFETSFEISLEKALSYDFLGLGESISLAYTQKSFWQTARSSTPFRETNYMPEIFMLNTNIASDTLKAYKVGILHSSNGKDKKDSRSTNRIYADLYFQYGNLFIKPTLWYKIPLGYEDVDSKKFYKYYGYGELNFLYAYKKHTFEATFRDNLKTDNKGSIELNWLFPFGGYDNLFAMIQFFHGYGYNLIDFNKNLTTVGFGVAFSR